MWPVDAVVGENGALYMRHDERAGKLRKRYALSDDERRAGRDRLQRISERILREVPGCALASDQPYRECDLAIDYCEDVPAAIARGGRPHRRADARRRHDGKDLVDPRQWLVRRLRQARDDAHVCCARNSTSTSSAPRRISSSWATRRTMRRCSNSSLTRWAWPTSGASSTASPRRPRTSPSAKPAPASLSLRRGFSRGANTRGGAGDFAPCGGPFNRPPSTSST